MRLSFSIPGQAAEAIQIDERSLLPEGFLDYQQVRRGKGFTFSIVADLVVTRAIRKECWDRLSMQGGEGFGDPMTWRSALKQAIINLDRVLEGRTE